MDEAGRLFGRCCVDWFQAVLAARRWTTLDDIAATPELKSTLAGLAASRLKAAPQVFVEIPDLDEKSLFHPRIEMHPALFLLEQALLSGTSTPLAEVREIKTLDQQWGAGRRRYRS